MKNILLTGFLILITSGFVLSQSNEIGMIEKGIFKKKVYVKCDIELTDQQFVNLFSHDENLLQFYKPLVLNYAANSLLTSAASVLILWPVTESLYNNRNPHWNLAIIGAGCAALSVPFKLGFNKHAKKAVDFYNHIYPNTSAVNLNFNVSTSGVGIVMNF